MDAPDDATAVMRSRPTNLAMLITAFAALYVIWGSTYLGIRYAIETLPPFLMAGVRFTAAGIVLYAVVGRRGPRPTMRQWRNTAIVGGLLLLGGNGLVCFGQQQIPSGLAALLVATLPLWMAGLHWGLFEGPRPSVRTIGGIVLGLLGLGLLLGDSSLFAAGSTGGWYALVVLAAPAMWGFGSLFSRRADLPGSVWQTTAMQLLCGGGLLLLTGLLSGEAGRVNFEAVSTASITALFYLIVFGSLIAYSAYVWLLKHVEPHAVATYAFVNPVVAVLLGWLFVNETMTLVQAGGMALVVAAVALTVLKPRRPADRSLPTTAAGALTVQPTATSLQNPTIKQEPST